MKKLQTFILIPVIILVLAAGGTAYAGSYIQNYRNGKRIIEISDNYIKDYSSGKRLLEIRDRYITDYSFPDN